MDYAQEKYKYVKKFRLAIKNNFVIILTCTNTFSSKL